MRQWVGWKPETEVQGTASGHNLWSQSSSTMAMGLETERYIPVENSCCWIMKERKLMIHDNGRKGRTGMEGSEVGGMEVRVIFGQEG